MENGLAWDGFASALDLHDQGGSDRNNNDKKKRQRLSGTIVDKRLVDLQSQLITTNERSHALESFIKEQEGWLEQERLEHAATANALRDAEQRLTEERMVHQIQLGVVGDLAEPLEQMRRTVDDLTEQLRLAREEAEQLGQEKGMLSMELAMTKDTVEVLGAEVALVKSEALLLASQYDQTNVELQMVRQDAAQLASQHDQTNLELQMARQDAAQLVSQYDQTIVELQLARQNSAQLVSQYDQTNAELQMARETVTQLGVQLESSRNEAYEACAEASRLGEALAESRPAAVDARVREALRAVVLIACRLGDPQNEAEALTKCINYRGWRESVGTVDELDPELIQGAATVIGTLVPILYGLFLEVGQHNEKLVSEYDALVQRARQLETDLSNCKCPELRAHIAQIEKEMSEAEALIHQQNGVNKDLHTRVQHRSALESVQVDGASLLRDLVLVQDQKRQLEVQVQGLERSLAATRSLAEKLQTEKGELSSQLLEAQKQIPPPRSLLYVKDLSDNVEELRRSLGPMGEEHCTFCTLCLGKAREAERKLEIAEQGIVEEQRRLVRMTQDHKKTLDSRIRAIEAEATERATDEKKKTSKLERRIAEAEAKLKESERMRETENTARDQQLREQRTIWDRKVAAKNEQIESLEVAAAQAGVAKQALAALDALLGRHRFRSAPLAERFNAAYHDAVRSVHARESTLQVRNAFLRLEGDLREFGLWLRSDEAVRRVCA